MGMLERIMDIGPEVGAELGRLGTQGQMELANAIFNGSAFVPYGPGQYTPTPEMEQPQQSQEVAMPQQECDGIER